MDFCSILQTHIFLNMLHFKHIYVWSLAKQFKFILIFSCPCRHWSWPLTQCWQRHWNQHTQRRSGKPGKMLLSISLWWWKKEWWKLSHNALLVGKCMWHEHLWSLNNRLTIEAIEGNMPKCNSNSWQAPEWGRVFFWTVQLIDTNNDNQSGE